MILMGVVTGQKARYAEILEEYQSKIVTKSKTDKCLFGSCCNF